MFYRAFIISNLLIYIRQVSPWLIDHPFFTCNMLAIEKKENVKQYHTKTSILRVLHMQYMPPTCSLILKQLIVIF